MKEREGKEVVRDGRRCMGLTLVVSTYDLKIKSKLPIWHTKPATVWPSAFLVGSWSLL